MPLHPFGPQTLNFAVSVCASAGACKDTLTVFLTRQLLSLEIPLDGLVRRASDGSILLPFRSAALGDLLQVLPPSEELEGLQQVGSRCVLSGTLSVEAAAVVELSDVTLHFGSLQLSLYQIKESIQNPIPIAAADFSFDSLLEVVACFGDGVDQTISFLRESPMRNIMSKFKLGGQILVDSSLAQMTLSDMRFGLGALQVSWDQVKLAMRQPVNIDVENFSLDELFQLFSEFAGMLDDSAARAVSNCEVLSSVLSKFVLSGQLCLDGREGKISVKDAKFHLHALKIDWEQVRDWATKRIEIDLEKVTLDSLLDSLKNLVGCIDESANEAIISFQDHAIMKLLSKFKLGGQIFVESNSRQMTLSDMRFGLGALQVSWDQVKLAMRQPVNIDVENFSLDELFQLFSEFAGMLDDSAARAVSNCEVLSSVLSKFVLSGQLCLDGREGKISVKDAKFHLHALKIDWEQVRDWATKRIEIDLEKVTLDSLLDSLKNLLGCIDESANEAIISFQDHAIMKLLSKFKLGGQIFVESNSRQMTLSDMRFGLGALQVSWDQVKLAMRQPVNIDVENFSLDELFQLFSEFAGMLDDSAARAVSNCEVLSSVLSKFVLSGQLCLDGREGKISVKDAKFHLHALKIDWEQVRDWATKRIEIDLEKVTLDSLLDSLKNLVGCIDESANEAIISFQDHAIMKLLSKFKLRGQIFVESNSRQMTLSDMRFGLGALQVSWDQVKLAMRQPVNIDVENFSLDELFQLFSEFAGMLDDSAARAVSNCEVLSSVLSKFVLSGQLCLDGREGKISVKDAKFHLHALKIDWEQVRDWATKRIEIDLEKVTLDSLLDSLKNLVGCIDESANEAIISFQDHAIMKLLSKFKLGGQIFVESNSRQMTLSDMRFGLGALQVSWDQVKLAMRQPVNIDVENFSLDELFQLFSEFAGMLDDSAARAVSNCEVLSSVLSKFVLSGQLCLDGREGKISVKDAKFHLGSLTFCWEDVTRALHERVEVRFQRLTLSHLMTVMSEAAALFDVESSSCINQLQPLCDQHPALEVVVSKFGLSGYLCLSSQPKDLRVHSIELQIGLKVSIPLSKIIGSVGAGMEIEVACSSDLF